MNIETVRRVALARHLFELAKGSLRSKNELHLFSAVNLAQDAVESFLIALASHFNVTFDQNTKFDKYFGLIDEKIAPRELPFRSAMLNLNRVRINSKHHGIQPAREECERLLASAHEFFCEATLANLETPFSTLSAIELLSDGECKQLLLQAKEALESSSWEFAIVSCRQALYVDIERHYDISGFENEDLNWLDTMLTKAPYYARNLQYISKHVMEPTDYIVLDHAAVDQDLLKSGVDPTDFWNVWRLTPAVFRSKVGKWYVKRDFSKLQCEDLNEIAAYVFNKTLDVQLARETNRRATLSGKTGGFYVDLAKSSPPLYSKANRSSSIAGTLPDTLLRVDTDYTIEGLVDDGLYWHVCHFEGNVYYFGFIHNDDVLIKS